MEGMTEREREGEVLRDRECHSLEMWKVKKQKMSLFPSVMKKVRKWMERENEKSWKKKESRDGGRDNGKKK